jgi:N-acetyl-anhydromuramoyl-L-alanine amidase
VSQHASDIDDGWIEAAARVESPNCDARPPGADIDLIVIHAISLPPGEFGGAHVHQLFCNRLDAAAHDYFREIAALRVSAHFFIDRDGAVTQFVDIRDRAWHAGVSCWEGRSACNDFSLGIELEGCDQTAFTEVQYDALFELIAELMAIFPAITPARIVGHCDIAPGRKTDPGPCFDWTLLRRRFSV